MRAVYGAGTPDEKALAVWMDRLGMNAEAPVAEGN
jgi:transcriptional regulator